MALPVPQPDPYVPPVDAEDMYRRDGKYILGLVRKLLGGSLQDAEDVAADITEKLIASDVIGMYNPEHVSEHHGKKVRVTWRAFLSSNIAIRVRGKRETLARRAHREPLLCDTTVGEAGQSWAEHALGGNWDDYPFLDDASFFSRLRDYIATVPATWDGPCSLLALFDEMVDRLRRGEPAMSRRMVAGEYGISVSAAAARLNGLRESITAAGTDPPGIPEFDIAHTGQSLSAADVRSAAEALRAARGNRVQPALEAIAHPLAKAPKNWYLKFAREEIRAYPEIKVPIGTHAAGAPGEGWGSGGHSDQVKRAVIHRLERMLTEAMLPVTAPEPDPEPDPTRRDIFESELWHITGLTPEQVDAVIAAAERVYART